MKAKVNMDGGLLKNKSNSLIKKILVGATLATTLGMGFWASKAFYTIKEVIDGDTFVTSENQYVRFDKVDAPEIDYCLGKQSKDELSKLILNKKVFIKVSYIEQNRNRLIGSVYTTNGDVEETMLKKGLATLRGGAKRDNLSNATNYAQNKNLGVYSNLCTQQENLQKPECNIKGNNRDGQRMYRFPGCKNYDSTLVQLYRGDQWFCTEAEAKKAGFTKGGDCK